MHLGGGVISTVHCTCLNGFASPASNYTPRNIYAGTSHVQEGISEDRCSDVVFHESHHSIELFSVMTCIPEKNGSINCGKSSDCAEGS